MTKDFDFETYKRNLNRILQRAGYAPVNVREASSYARQGLSPRKAADAIIWEANQHAEAM